MKISKGRLLWVLGLAAAVYAMVCIDVVLRARQAYLQGEQAKDPKEAYAWYESAATLYTPPESKWTRLAREKMPQAKERWKADLKARHVPFDDTMLN